MNETISRELQDYPRGSLDDFINDCYVNSESSMNYDDFKSSLIAELKKVEGLKISIITDKYSYDPKPPKILKFDSYFSKIIARITNIKDKPLDLERIKQFLGKNRPEIAEINLVNQKMWGMYKLYNSISSFDLFQNKLEIQCILGKETNHPYLNYLFTKNEYIQEKDIYVILDYGAYHVFNLFNTLFQKEFPEYSIQMLDHQRYK